MSKPFSSFMGLIILSLTFTACNSYKESLKILPSELSIANECINTNKSFEIDCYDLISYKNSFAQIRLGINAQKNGNNEEAFQRYMFAKSKGNFYANALLADMYNKGLFVKQNSEIVVDLLEDVKKVDPIAAYKLSFLYISKQKNEKAIELLEFAALNNLKEAQNELKKIYSQGTITKIDLEKSNYWEKEYLNNPQDFQTKIYGF